MFTSSYRRGGEPVLVAFGLVPEGGHRAVRCGLLFVREGLEQPLYQLRDGGQSHRVRLPPAYLGQGDSYYTDAVLEVVNE